MKSFSQAGQDKFVLTMLQNKKNGKYIEIGASDPIFINNTYLLEQDYEWVGFSLDIVNECIDKFNSVRKNKCVLADGTTFDYQAHIEKIWGNIDRIDYLQVDCEPAENTYKCLTAVPLDKYRFSVITFETDVYASGNNVRDKSRKELFKYGYELVASDVTNEGNVFEDWYIDPLVIDKNIFETYICHGKEGKTIC
jgi:hypothetical protein